MTRYLLAAAMALGCLALFGVWFSAREEAAEQRGVDKQITLDVAKANQELATRRETDATFDKMDARQHCLDAGLEWVFLDGKSLCR